jgi:uncharacterized protein (DUF2235 family)
MDKDSEENDLPFINPKSVILLFDGTGNSLATGGSFDHTNVSRVAYLISYRTNQKIVYMPGVGTRGEVLSQATGRGLDHLIREAYVNLALNYEPGTWVYIFGFSRGAAAAQALTEMISKVGLLKPPHLDHMEKAWAAFLRSRLSRPPDDIENYLRSFVWKPQDEPRIRFLGLFDTVAGVGWDKGRRFTETRFDSHELPPHVDVAVQILAIDDNRIPSFEPFLWTAPSRSQQIIEQIWMPGVHGDIGGSSSARFLSDVALLTILDRQSRYQCGLNWDAGAVRIVLDGLAGHPRVEVSNERFDLKRRVLRKQHRLIGSLSQETGSPRFTNERVHPLLDDLIAKEFWIKGKVRAYIPRPAIPDYLELVQTSFDGIVRDALKQIFSRKPI